MDGRCEQCAGADRGLADRLRALLGGDAWFMRAARAVAVSGLPDAWIGAGAVRDLVWGRLFGEFRPAEVRDIDVAYFDQADLRRERDEEAEQALARCAAGLP